MDQFTSKLDIDPGDSAHLPNAPELEIFDVLAGIQQLLNGCLIASTIGSRTVSMPVGRERRI